MKKLLLTTAFGLSLLCTTALADNWTNTGFYGILRRLDLIQASCLDQKQQFNGALLQFA